MYSPREVYKKVREESEHIENKFKKYAVPLATGILACYLALTSPLVSYKNDFHNTSVHYTSAVENTKNEMYARRRHRHERKRSRWWDRLNIFKQLEELKKRKYRIPPEKKIRSEKENYLDYIV